MVNKFKGSIMGLAVGDAVGTTLEFKEVGTFKHIKDMVGGGVFNLKSGQWTDDTSMALCLLDSLLKNGFNKEDQIKTYLKWYEKGYLSSNGICFDIGITTKKAIDNYKLNGKIVIEKNKNITSNGSIMRLAPIPLYYLNKDENFIMNVASQSSETTHDSKICKDCCKYMAIIINRLVKGATKEQAMIRPNSIFCEEVNEIINGSYKKNFNIKTTGYVIDTLNSALWSFYNTKDFTTGLLNLVNLGGDSDTTGAVYGQIAGAYYGFNAIPEKWVNKIALKEKIFKMIDSLFKIAITL